MTRKQTVGVDYLAIPCEVEGKTEKVRPRYLEPGQSDGCHL